MQIQLWIVIEQEDGIYIEETVKNSSVALV